MKKFLEQISREIISILIEKCRPEGCKDYQFTNELKRLFSLLSIVEFSSVYPIVFEMLERLKEIYDL